MEFKVIKEDYEPHTMLEAPLSISEHNTQTWLDTKARALSFPFKPSVKVQHERGKILCAMFPSTTMEVVPEDTLVAGYRLVCARLNPLILNFADDEEAGGLVDNGNSAQEESLWRRTNLCATQLQTFYPLAQNPVQEGIYTPEATVFKDTEANNCVDLHAPWQAAFIAVPGLKFPRTNIQNLVCLEDLMRMRAKIELICQTAKHYGHDALVLGPLGCGVWRSPPKQMAEIMRSVLSSYRGVFKHVTFACLAKGVVGASSNYAIFKEVFCRPIL
jgi:uncharacterized protein (TIGR02452 family)